MGGLGSDAAIEAADVVIMNDQPSKIADAIRLAKKREDRQTEHCFAIGIKYWYFALGAFGFATMGDAVFADVGGNSPSCFECHAKLTCKNKY